MAEIDNCSNCAQSQDCGTVYQQLGRAKGPSVTTKVLTAFLLPIAVFIIALGVFENILTGYLKNDNLRIAIGFVLAAGVTFTCILIASAINRRYDKNKTFTVFQGDRQSQQ